MENVLSAYAGNAGEYFVVAQLLRLGWHAALTARGSRAYDVLAHRRGIHVDLRVKTKTAAARGFQWNCKKTGEIFLDLRSTGDFTILVDIPEEICAGPTYYVLPTATINDWLCEDFDRWCATPGAKGQARNRDNPRRIMYLDEGPRSVQLYRERLKPYCDGWYLLDGGDS